MLTSVYRMVPFGATTATFTQSAPTLLVRISASVRRATHVPINSTVWRWTSARPGSTAALPTRTASTLPALIPATAFRDIRATDMTAKVNLYLVTLLLFIFFYHFSYLVFWFICTLNQLPIAYCFFSFSLPLLFPPNSFNRSVFNVVQLFLTVNWGEVVCGFLI